MEIIIAGSGKVGLTLARQLASEGHNITLIDKDSLILEEAVEQFESMAVCGNCASKEVLLQAGTDKADLVIAATSADEVNLLCCMTAHGLNSDIHTIARIRNPEYAEQVLTMPEIFPLSLTVNPEKQAALEIERLLKFPGFLRRDTFAKGQVEIVELRIDENSKLRDVALSDLTGIVKCKVLVCADGNIKTLAQGFAHTGGHDKTAFGINAVMGLSQQFLCHSRLLPSPLSDGLWERMPLECYFSPLFPTFKLSISKVKKNCKYFFPTANY